MYIKLVPKRLATIGSFTAEDPWNGFRRTPYNIEEYVMTGTGGNGSHLLAIRSEIDGVERFVPEAIVHLWRQKKLPAEYFPRLLAAMTPSLQKDDYYLFLEDKWKKHIGFFVALITFPVFAAILYFKGGPFGDIGLLPSIGTAAAFSVVIGVIASAAMMVPMSRRKKQMAWIARQLPAMAEREKRGDTRYIPAGADAKAPGKLRQFAMIFAALIVGVLILIGGVIAVGFSRGGTAQTKQERKADDIQTTLSITPEEARNGKEVEITSPGNQLPLKVKIPAGIKDGTRLRLRGEGVIGYGVPNGDLYITVHLK